MREANACVVRMVYKKDIYDPAHYGHGQMADVARNLVTPGVGRGECREVVPILFVLGVKRRVLLVYNLRVTGCPRRMGDGVWGNVGRFACSVFRLL